ncbi:MAG: hypothetical protein M1124_00530 [Candidatus Marsarchaeota archaeon]|nr:hypothetical protein [Candidatus Marsarchaeota archaeon]
MENGKSIGRKLYAAIDSLVDEMNQKYGLCISEDANRKINDLSFKRALVDYVQDLVKFRKTSEKFLDAELAEITYEIRMEISSTNMKMLEIKKLI